MMYHRGQFGERSNCIPWFLKAAAQGNVEAQAEVAELHRFYPTSELLKSVDVIGTLRQSAEKGNLDAQFQLARRYQAGDGVPKDPTQAFKWMQRAAQNETRGNVVSKARYQLGLMYETGSGVPPDVSKARKLFRDATFADFVDPNASFRVGQMYEKGEDLPQDDYEAVARYYDALLVAGGEFKSEAIESLFRLYADNRGFSKANRVPVGDSDYEKRLRDIPALIKYLRGMIDTPKAQFYVGEIYYHGKLAQKDIVESAAWLQLATKQGLGDARLLLDKLEPEMSSAQKDAATNRAKELTSDLKPNR